MRVQETAIEEAPTILRPPNKFWTQYNKPPILYDPGGGEKKVQTLGYMTSKQKIEQIRDAGVRLAAARAEQYDADIKTKPTEIAANRLRGMDLLDGIYQTTQIANYLKNKRTRLEREAKDAKELEAKTAKEKVETTGIQTDTGVDANPKKDTTTGVN